MESSEAVDARVHREAAKLENFYDRIIGCHVVIDAPHRHGRKGHIYTVTVELSVPGGPPVVVGQPHHDQHAHEDVYVAIRDAFSAMRRQLQDRVRKMRGDVKSHEVPTHGRIQQLMPAGRYGFVVGGPGPEVYFHENALVGVKFDELEIGDEVRYVVHEGEGEHGPQASTVRPIGKHHLADADTI